MINRVKAKIFTQKIRGSILGAPVQNIGGFDRIIFITVLPTIGSLNVLYVDKTNLLFYFWDGFGFELIRGESVSETDPLFTAWLSHNPTSGTNTGDQNLTPYLLKDTELQTAETPTDTSLFSSWNGTARVKHTLLAIWNFLKAKADLLYVSVTLRIEKHTGFYSSNDPRNKKILVTYNGDKTVTLNRSDGVFQGYYEGLPIAGLTNGYTSPAISETTPTGLWFLYYNGTDVIWSQTPFLFSHCMITIAYFRTDGTFLFVVPETHGFMPESTHEELHKAIGAYGYSGNGVSGYTLNSTTATNRRPTFEAGVIADEDKFTDLALMNGNYTRSWITSGGSITSDWNNTEIIPLNGARPIINVITNGLGSQVDITNNNYCAIFVFKIAVGADADSQRYRCVILQPQHQGTLTQMQAISFTNVNINGLAGISNEIIFTQKIIVRYTALNWTITSIENISGNARFSVIVNGVSGGVNELNVSMDARTHLTGLTLDANADIINDYITNHKPWTTSGHTMTPNTIAGSDASGNAKEYALADLGGAKRLVIDRSYIGGYTNVAYDIDTNGVDRICYCSPTAGQGTKILDFNLTIIASVAVDAEWVKWISSRSEFWVLSSGLITRLSANGSILGTIASTYMSGYFCCNSNYAFLRKLNGTTYSLCRITLSDLTVADYAGINQPNFYMDFIGNYLFIATITSATRVYDENLNYINTISSTDSFFSIYQNNFRCFGSQNSNRTFDISNINAPFIVESHCYFNNGNSNFMAIEQQIADDLIITYSRREDYNDIALILRKADGTPIDTLFLSSSGTLLLLIPATTPRHKVKWYVVGDSIFFLSNYVANRTTLFKLKLV